jgi:hypothetical protein
MLKCPPGFSCQVLCTGAQSCQGAQIQCPDSYGCTAECGSGAGAAACQSAQIQCSDQGVCYLGCTGMASCQGATITCGHNGCTAGCQQLASKPVVVCGAACGCNGC